MTETQVIDDGARFAELRHEWNELLLASSSACLFLTWEWMHTWWKYLAGDRKLHIITVRAGGLLIAVAPLAVRPAFTRHWMPAKALEFLGSGTAGSDFLSFLVRRGHEEIALGEIAKCLAESNLMLELVRVEKTSLPMIGLASHLRQSGWDAVYLTTNYCPYITLSGHTWESYLNSLHSTHRSNVNKALRKLHRNFDVSLTFAKSEAERRVALDSYMQFHLARWSRQGGSSAIGDQAQIDFHQEFSAMSLDRGWLRLYTLSLDGDPAAWIYLFRFQDVCYYYQSAFDERYSQYSVGTIVLSLVIKDAIEDGALEFNLLHDDDEYKYLWAHEEYELIRLELYPPLHVGRLYQKAAYAKHWWGRSARKHALHRDFLNPST